MGQIKMLLKRILLYIRQNWKLGILMVGGVIVISFGLYKLTNGGTTDKNTRDLYNKRLTELDQAVAAIPDNLKQHSSANKNDLDSYFDGLSNILAPCGQMTAAYDTRNPKIKSQKLKDNMTQVNQLCGDLVGVAKYSQNVYAACQEYLYFGIQWPTTQDPGYLTDLNNADNIIKITKARLQKVDNSKAQDPALSELISQLDSAHNLADDIKKAIDANNYSQANTLSSRFIKQINQDKVDFLSARNYFWHNTIQYDSLQKAIKKQEENFNTLKL